MTGSVTVFAGDAVEAAGSELVSSRERPTPTVGSAGMLTTLTS